jgi:hypothetical protein
MIHNATIKRRIIGLTPPSRGEGTARGSKRSGGLREGSKDRGGGVEPIYSPECGVMTLFHSRAS